MDDVKNVVKETLLAVLPIVSLVIVIQLLLFEDPLYEVLQLIIGATMVSFGLGLFLLGVKVGLLSIGDTIGSELPQRFSFPLILFSVFCIGLAVTVAEPDVLVLAQQVDYVSGDHISKTVIIAFIGLGVGVFLAIAAARVFLGIPMRYILVFGYILAFALAYFVPPNFLPVAFDSGGVTTGNLTVPFVVALGVGLTSVLGGKSSLSDSFGFLALASLGPILTVLLLGVLYV